MKRIYSFLIVMVMVITNIFGNWNSVLVNASQNDFYNLSDPALLTYVEDQVYSNLENTLASDDYIIEDIQTVYISKEYLEEVAYNSLENIYFGYSLKEVCEQFEGTKFIFTLGENGATEVQEFEAYDNTFNQVVKNVAIGTGVIVICITVSVVTAGTGAPAVVSAVFATSAKSAAIAAVSSGAIGGTMAGIVTGIQTKDFDEAIKAAVVTGSEGFKWGAITGAVSGGASEILKPRTVVVPASVSLVDDVTNVADDAINVVDDVVNVTDDTVNVVDDVANVADDAVSVVDDAAKVTDDMINNASNAWRKSELKALKKYGGNEQKSFLGGKEVSMQTPGATKPDIVRQIDGHLEAIEVKNYDLESNVTQLCNELKRQIGQRVNDLPKGSTQRIVLDVEGRGYSANIIDDAINSIQSALRDVYPDIPIDIL